MTIMLFHIFIRITYLSKSGYLFGLATCLCISMKPSSLLAVEDAAVTQSKCLPKFLSIRYLKLYYSMERQLKCQSLFKERVSIKHSDAQKVYFPLDIFIFFYSILCRIPPPFKYFLFTPSFFLSQKN